MRTKKLNRIEHSELGNLYLMPLLEHVLFVLEQHISGEDTISFWSECRIPTQVYFFHERCKKGDA